MNLTESRTNSYKHNIAKISGVSILLMALAAGFAYGFVINSIVVPDDSAATVKNIKNSSVLFTSGILVWLLIFLLDIIVAWALYIYFKSVNKRLALLTVWLRLMYTAFLVVVIFCLILIQIILSEGFQANALGSTQTEVMVMLLLEGFSRIWSIGLIVFGFHLMALGYLLSQAMDSPKLIPLLLIVAAVCYLFVHLSYLLFPSFKVMMATLELYLSIPMAAGELALGIWLLWKGVKWK